MYGLVSTFTNSFDDKGLIYNIPDNLSSTIQIGNIIEIPVGKNIELGVLLKIGTIKELELKIDENKIKQIINIYDDNIYINNYRSELVAWLANNYFSKIHHCLNLFIPKNLRTKIINKKVDIDSFKKREYKNEIIKPLNKIQDKIYNNILSSKKNVLLHGVTGSGKTEIYIKIIKNYLDNGYQSLLLVPEIILTNQLSERIINVFGKGVISIHSGITEATKTKHWIDIYKGSAKIIIGTRSSLFYPYKNLGIIIIDEEHDDSYKSDNNPRYDTVEVAEKISKLNGNKLVLGSGTPSINRSYKAIKGDYNLFNIFNKYK